VTVAFLVGRRRVRYPRGVKLVDLAHDARALTVDAFRAQHGEAFLLGMTGGLRAPKRFDQTRSAPVSRGPASDQIEWIVLPVVKRERSLSLVRLTVGRTANNDVHVEDASVSRLHAFFEPGAPAFTLKDAGSRLGTKVNGQPVTAATLVRSGDQVAFGDVELTCMTAAAFVDFIQRMT
jgi:hypothetical protein